jgi:hypothetical protein
MCQYANVLIKNKKRRNQLNRGKNKQINKKRMKNLGFMRFTLFVFLLALLTPSSLHAQRFKTQRDSLQYLVDSQPDSTRHGFFNAGKFNSTFHVQFEGDITYLYHQYAALTGFQVAWVVNHRLSIGAKFDILSTEVVINKYINTLDSLYTTNPATYHPIHPLSMSGMINIGYIFRADKKIAIEPDLGIGWTYMSFTDPKDGWIDTTEAKRVNFIQNYLIVNPSLSVIWNTTKYFRIGAVVGAQGVFGEDYLRLKTYRLRSVYAGIFLRFGTF